MCMEEHLLGVVNPLNESQYLEGLVSDSRPDDTRGKKKKKVMHGFQFDFQSI